MNHKYFSLDKNYILKQAQADYQQEFLGNMVEMVKSAYYTNCNPLGLYDKLIEDLQRTKTYKLEHLEFFYLKLAGIYRFKFGNDNQLEFVFNGPSHYEIFKTEWEDQFYSWIREFSRNEGFIRAVLEIAVFFPEDRKVDLAETKLNTFLQQHFDLKIRKKRGINAFKIA